jgi:hypothetical protein
MSRSNSRRPTLSFNRVLDCELPHIYYYQRSSYLTFPLTPLTSKLLVYMAAPHGRTEVEFKRRKANRKKRICVRAGAVAEWVGASSSDLACTTLLIGTCLPDSFRVTAVQ